MTTGGGPIDGAVTVRGARLHYVDWGPAPGTGGGRPVVLLHGLQDTARNWDPIAAALRARYHVYALDSRGHGDSDWTPGRYQFTNYVHEAGDFLDALDLHDAFLVGHSAGGKYSFCLAADRPERVAGLVIVDMDPDAVNPGSATMFDRYRGESDEYRDLDAVAERLRLRSPHASAVALAHLAQVMTRPLPHDGLTWKRDRRVVLEYQRPDAWEYLPRIHVHTLLVRGAESTLLRRDVAERMARTIPACALVEIPQAGHWCYDDAPGGFLHTVGTFLDAASGTR